MERGRFAATRNTADRARGEELWRGARGSSKLGKFPFLATRCRTKNCWSLEFTETALSVDITSWAHIWELCRDDYVLLRVDDTGDPVDGCLIYDMHTGASELIEDDEIYRAIKLRMLDAGIPVVTRDALPPLKDSPEPVVTQMIDAGKSASEINVVLAQYRERDNERQRRIQAWHARRNA